MHISSAKRSTLVGSTVGLLAAPLAALAQNPLKPLGNVTIETLTGRAIGALLGLTGVIALVVNGIGPMVVTERCFDFEDFTDTPFTVQRGPHLTARPAPGCLPPAC